MASDRISERANGLVHQAAEMGSNIGERVRRQMGSFRQGASDYVGHSGELIRGMQHSIADEIRAHPSRWLVVSAITGVAIGLVAYLLFRED